MFDKLSYEQFVALAQDYKRVALYQEIPGDQLTPVNAYYGLGDLAKNCTLLESNSKEAAGNRYSYLCFEAVAEVKVVGQGVFVSHDNKIERSESDPFAVLRDYQKKLFAKTVHPLSALTGGMVGFFSYDAIRLIENIPDRHQHDGVTPDLLFRFYNNTITFDHKSGKVVVATIVETDGDLKKIYETAFDKVDSIASAVLSKQNKQDTLKKVLQKNCFNDDEAYLEKVRKAKDYIVKGDIFQVVLSRKFERKYTAKPFDIYRALRFCSPSPYMFYIHHDDFVVAGASPEKLVSIKDKVVEVCPLAGTRPRQDSQQQSDLLQDEKELAEHMMLVDLARNDVGAVAVPGTVKVAKLKQIENFSHVSHISSTIQGELKENLDALDVIKASFPAGTLSGAPKIRAMEIIDELEDSRRGVYGGAICAIDSLGNLESCIAIRMAVIRDGVATVRTGAGIVHDSVPQAEADETRHKAKSVLEAIALAEGGVL